jgi:hypothetical protein
MKKWKTLLENSNYEISNEGELRNKKGKLLSLNMNKRGYLYCNISSNGKVSKVKIHILVAKYFVDNPFNKDTVNHRDGNKLNNHYLNLEWLTRKENIRHGWKTGLYKSHNPYKR